MPALSFNVIFQCFKNHKHSIHVHCSLAETDASKNKTQIICKWEYTCFLIWVDWPFKVTINSWHVVTKWMHKNQKTIITQVSTGPLLYYCGALSSELKVEGHWGRGPRPPRQLLLSGWLFRPLRQRRISRRQRYVCVFGFVRSVLSLRWSTI